MGAPKNYSTRSLTKADQPEIDAVLAANPMWKLKHARESVARRKFLRRCGLIKPQRPVRIVRQNHFNGHGVRTPYSWLYSLEGETPNYEGTPLASIRRIAKQLAAQRATTVVEAWS